MRAVSNPPEWAESLFCGGPSLLSVVLVCLVLAGHLPQPAQSPGLTGWPHLSLPAHRPSPAHVLEGWESLARESVASSQPVTSIPQTEVAVPEAGPAENPLRLVGQVAGSQGLLYCFFDTRSGRYLLSGSASPEVTPVQSTNEMINEGKIP